MANEPWIARIGWINHADGATLTAVHAGPETLGVDRLKIKYTAQFHQQDGPELAVRVSFTEPKPVDSIVLPMVNAGPTATMRVLANSARDMAGTSLYAYTGTANVDPAINYAIHLLPNTVTAQHWEVAVTDPSLTASRAGRLAMMPLHRFAANFKPDWNRTWEDISDEREGDDGTMYDREKPKRRVFTCDFGFLVREEADGVALEIERVVGKTRDVLLVARPNAPNLGHYTIWGKPVDAGGVNQPSLSVFTKQFKIRERRR